MASNPVRFVCGACGHWWHAVAWVDARRLVQCPECGVTRGRVDVTDGDEMSVAIELVTQAADLLGGDLMLHDANDEHVDGFVIGTRRYLDLVGASVDAVEGRRVV
ncbi:hypothetical protein LCGC14_1847650 [marine sediment metagenome]|uniref:Uncharacterized protein n=1 Tax=marine sediment metagenome TaxID=412755 RepID=A0A0F9GB86_9ZZZZ